MRITPLAKAFITVVVLGVMGYAFWSQRRAGDPPPAGETAAVRPQESAGSASIPDGAALARIRSRGTLLVGMDTGEPPWTGTPPMYFPDEAGRPDGFDHSLASHVARTIGVGQVNVVHAKYSELPGRLRHAGPDAIDLLISGYSPIAESGIAWSDPYLEFGLCLVVPAASKVRTVSDLFGKPVGIFDDEAAARAVTTLVKGYTGLVRLEDGYWDQLLQGRFAGFIYDYPYAIAEIAAFYRQNPHRKGAFRIAQYNLTDSTYAVGVRQGEPELLAAVNRAIASWRDSEAYRAAVRRYLAGGESVDAPVAAGRSVAVRAGDTLSLIARRELGTDARWRDLWELNKSRFPNPHLIEVGDKVLLP